MFKGFWYENWINIYSIQECNFHGRWIYIYKYFFDNNGTTSLKNFFAYNGSIAAGSSSLSTLSNSNRRFPFIHWFSFSPYIFFFILEKYSFDHPLGINWRIQFKSYVIFLAIFSCVTKIYFNIQFYLFKILFQLETVEAVQTNIVSFRIIISSIDNKSCLLIRILSFLIIYF